MNSPDSPDQHPATRIDSAHPVSRSATPGHAPVKAAVHAAENDADHAAAAVDGAPEMPQPIENLMVETGFSGLEMQQHVLDQANQLAAHLRNRQRELDRREATLHAQIASLENENRLSRLWFQEQQHEQAEAEAALRQQEQELEARAADLAAAGMAMDEEFTRHQTENDSQLLLIESRAHSLDRREEQIAATQLQAQQLAAHTQRRAALTNMLGELAAAIPELSLQAVQDAARQIKLEKISLAGLTAELDGRAEDLKQQEIAQQKYAAELEQQAASLEEDREDLAAREAALEEGIAALTTHANDLDARALEVASHAATYAENTTVEEVSKWQEQLQARENILNQQLEEVADEAAALQRQRELFEQEQQAAHETLSTSRLEQQRRYDAKAEKLNNRERALDERSEALHQMEATVATTHRETLEMRLVTQQLWTRLTGIAPPGELTSSLAQIRGRLADHFQMASSSLEKQKQELLELSARLDQRQEQVRQQRIEVQEWVARRHEEIEEQAARLVAREQELEAQQRQFDKAGQAMQHKHRQQQLELRQLLSGTQSVA